MPIVLDPIYFIPFIIAPLIMVSTSYAALSLGLVSRVRTQIVWSMPPILNAFVGTMDWRSVVLQLINMVIGFLIYVPFVKAANNVKPQAEA
jgi:cellobiose PTS system EIIC component